MYHHGCLNVLAQYNVVLAILNLNPIYFAYKVFHIMVIHHLNYISTLKFNSLNSPIPMIVLPWKRYMPLLNEICSNGWNVSSIIILTADAKGTTHISTLQILYEQVLLPQDNIKTTLTQLNIISIQFLTSIILHKCKIEYHQPLPDPYDPP